MKRWGMRLAGGVLSLLLLLLVNFALPRLLPGDPLLMLTGQEEATLSPAQAEAYREALGLRLSMPAQFSRMLGQLARGDLGYSYVEKKGVAQLLRARIPVTLRMVLPALVLSTCIAMPLGCLCGYFAHSRWDRTLSNVFLLLDALPAFWLAMVLVGMLSFRWGLFPLGGLHSVQPPTNAFAYGLDGVWHMALPVATLTIASTPGKFLVLRHAFAAAREEPYVRFAQARGLSTMRICTVHLLKTVCAPFLAVIGMGLGRALSGAMLIEVIFSMRGMGSLLYDAALNRDVPLLQGGLLVMGVCVVCANALTDALTLWLDPRGREMRAHA